MTTNDEPGGLLGRIVRQAKANAAQSPIAMERIDQVDDAILDECWHESLDAYTRERTRRILDILEALTPEQRYKVETYLLLLIKRRERTVGDLMADGTFRKV